MKLEAVKSFFNDPEKWQNFEYMVTSSGSTLHATNIVGFKRKRKFIDPNKDTIFNNPRNGIYENNWYFTYDENDTPSLGTLELDEELEVIRYQERLEGRIVEHDVAQIMILTYKKTDTPNYPGIGSNL